MKPEEIKEGNTYRIERVKNDGRDWSGNAVVKNASDPSNLWCVCEDGTGGWFGAESFVSLVKEGTPADIPVQDGTGGFPDIPRGDVPLGGSDRDFAIAALMLSLELVEEVMRYCKDPIHEYQRNVIELTLKTIKKDGKR